MIETRKGSIRVESYNGNNLNNSSKPFYYKTQVCTPPFPARPFDPAGYIVYDVHYCKLPAPNTASTLSMSTPGSTNASPAISYDVQTLETRTPQLRNTLKNNIDQRMKDLQVQRGEQSECHPLHPSLRYSISSMLFSLLHSISSTLFSFHRFDTI